MVNTISVFIVLGNFILFYFSLRSTRIYVSFNVYLSCCCSVARGAQWPNASDAGFSRSVAIFLFWYEQAESASTRFMCGITTSLCTVVTFLSIYYEEMQVFIFRLVIWQDTSRAKCRLHLLDSHGHALPPHGKDNIVINEQIHTSYYMYVNQSNIRDTTCTS